MPVFQGELAGDERGVKTVAILHEFEQVFAFWRSQGIQAPIIQDEQIRFGPELQQAEVTPIAMRNP